MLRLIPKFPEYQFVIGAAPSIEDAFYEEFINDENVYFVRNQTYSLFNLATVGMVASGTATLEAGIFGLPQVVCYKGNALSILIARSIIKVKYISLVNLIMDRELVKELIQNDLTTKALEKELTRLLDPLQRVKCLEDYDLLRQKLGGIGASKHAAIAMLKSL
jgi:lipid-A-disaccharide synthase